MANSRVRIATRASNLALWQARHVRDLLLAGEEGLTVELVEVVSQGDVVRDRPLAAIGGVGIFTKEVQDALLENRADLAVHSLKDLPTETPAELCIAAVPKRGPVHDVLLAPKHGAFEGLPKNAVVATSSLRRKAQLLARRPDLSIIDIRGNVETRIRKLHEQDLDGLILAEAGLRRLGLDEAITQVLPMEVMIPAVSQGALGIECRADDEATIARLAQLDDRPTRQAVEAERAFLRVLQGGCQVPIGAHAVHSDGRLSLTGIVLSEDGSRVIEGDNVGDPKDAQAIGRELAQRLIDQGASEVIRAR